MAITNYKVGAFSRKKSQQKMLSDVALVNFQFIMFMWCVEMKVQLQTFKQGISIGAKHPVRNKTKVG